MNDQIISQCLEETKAFSDLEIPVITTSGEFLTPFFINTENLLGDSNIQKVLEKHGDDSLALINYATKRLDKYPPFGEVIDRLCEKIKMFFPINYPSNKKAISGGQRRDWLFSGPVSRKLNLAHISLYKNGKIEFLHPAGTNYSLSDNDLYTLHVSDLMTKGSSAFRIENGEEKGWIPMLRKRGSTIDNLFTVVTRLQGGEKLLFKQGINTYSFVAIDEESLRAHSKQPEVVMAYLKNEIGWTINYLKENGISVLVPYFKPDNPKLPRAKAFLNIYNNLLSINELMPKLEEAVKKNYNKSLAEILN